MRQTEPALQTPGRLNQRCKPRCLPRCSWRFLDVCPGFRHLPPYGFPQDTTLRVAIEVRQGATRTIRNLHAVLQACEEADRKGEEAGTQARARKHEDAPCILHRWHP